MAQLQGRDGPSLDRLHVLDARGSRNYVYPADVKGRFNRLKPWVFSALIAIYVALPWVRIGGKPAILIDIPARHFYLFGKTFNAQDFYLVFFFLTAIGFGLILLAALFGRVWCGWACPQTVFMEGVFRRIERWIEGPANARLELARGPMTLNKLGRKAAKHGLYLLISFVLSHVFLSYFVSMPGLFRMMRGNPMENLTPFLWAVAITAIIYLNFWWFREQLCLIICPYGRLQSVMQDRDTVLIGYDRKRGEPRGKARDPGVGDCVDCRRCIAVCPTDIDIRNGLQLECVGCANCIDACDEIMDKLGRPRGLIRYDSERGLEEGRRRFIRPRLYGYAAAGLLGLVVASTVFMRHMPFEANLLRTRGLPYVVDGELLRNQIVLHLVNKNPVPSVLEITPEVGPASFIIPQQRIELPSLGSLQLPMVVTLPRATFRPEMRTGLMVHDSASGLSRRVEVQVMGPPGRPAR